MSKGIEIIGKLYAVLPQDSIREEMNVDRARTSTFDIFHRVGMVSNKNSSIEGSSFIYGNGCTVS